MARKVIKPYEPGNKTNQVPVASKVNEAIHRINHYPVVSIGYFTNTYLSTGQRFIQWIALSIFRTTRFDQEKNDDLHNGMRIKDQDSPMALIKIKTSII